MKPKFHPGDRVTVIKPYVAPIPDIAKDNEIFNDMYKAFGLDKDIRGVKPGDTYTIIEVESKPRTRTDGKTVYAYSYQGKSGKRSDFILWEEEIKLLSDKMIAMVEEHGMKFFLRDADNILSAECVVLIGTREQAQGLNCGHCGFATCAGRTEDVPCALNSIDVGIAIGSACATAADMRVDTRVMFSAGLAAQRLHWLKDCKMVMAIPVSASSKNPFFDRKPKQEAKA